MRRYRFGEGEYKYFDAPLPELIDGARHALYPPLAGLANEWAQRLGEPADFPAELDDFLDRCHRAGQRRTTPLILRYGEGGHNTLHQDVYGDVAFPLQVVTMLDRPGEDFEGGQFVLLEQRPRAQSRAHVIDLERGAFLIFPTRHRPVLGTRGYYRATMRHGVATVRSGQRTTLGVIFHDAAWRSARPRRRRGGGRARVRSAPGRGPSRRGPRPGRPRRGWPPRCARCWGRPPVSSSPHM